MGAISASSTGDTITVTDDANYLPITLDVDVLLRADTGAVPTITATTGFAAVVEVGTIQGITFVGSTSTDVVVDASECNAVFEDCTFQSGSLSFGRWGTPAGNRPCGTVSSRARTTL
jgi:hypothetical protein